MSPCWKLLKRACKFVASQRSSGQHTSHLSAPPPPPPHPPTHLCTLSTPPSLLPLCGGSIYRAALATLPPSVSFTSALPLPKGQVCSVIPSLFSLSFHPLISCSVSFFEGKVLCQGLGARSVGHVTRSDRGGDELTALAPLTEWLCRGPMMLPGCSLAARSNEI